MSGNKQVKNTNFLMKHIALILKYVLPIPTT